MKLLLCLPLLFLVACSSTKPRSQTPSAGAVPEKFDTVGGTASPDDVARFLAGRPVRHGEVLSRWQQSGNYRAHSATLMSNWTRLASRRTMAQTVWSDTNLRPLTGPARTVVYPFGGPDLLHAAALFPDASTYILLGLEPAGGLPALESADAGQVFVGLNRLATSTSTQLRSGYFITKDMRGDLTGGPMPGVTPILLATLSLMDARVDSVQTIVAGGNPAVEIRFTPPSGGSRRAIYVSGDLSNRGFSPAYRSWLDSYSGSIAYFKAASYLMHDSGFSSIRSWVLGNSSAIVQDDSGIPYSQFDSSKWNIRLFGYYDAPIELFSKHSQSDLRAAYAAGAGSVMPFGSGYHMQPENANLLVATRR